MSNARFSILQARAVGDDRVSDAQFRTLAALGCYGDAEGWCFPSLSTLGAKLHKSPQAVSKDIIALVAVGYVEKHPRFNEDGGRRSNLYRLRYDLPPSTSEVDTHSTSEVDTLSTPKVEVNDPVNDPLKRNEDERQVVRANLFKVYESEIGAITPFIADAIEGWVKDGFPPKWIEDAIREAAKQNKRSWSYCEAIINRRNAQGNQNPVEKQKPGQKPAAPRPATNYDANMAHVQRWLEQTGAENV